MSKGYWIHHADVHHAAAFEAYRARMAAALAGHQHKYLIRGRTQQQLEGSCRHRTVVIEFASYDAALACFNDPCVQAARQARLRTVDGTPVAEVDFLVCEGEPDT